MGLGIDSRFHHISIVCLMTVDITVEHLPDVVLVSFLHCKVIGVPALLTTL